MPEKWSRDNVTFTLSPATLKFASNVDNCDVIDDAIQRYGRIFRLYKETSPPENADLETVQITVENTTCEGYPYLEMDESYNVTMEPPSVLVRSESVWGALRGLETVSQLLFEENGQVLVKNWTVNDRPRFPHRGFMIDTARHYLPLSIIKKHLDAMSWTKLNVLHWHIVDAQSFPYVSHAFPELSEKLSPRAESRDQGDTMKWTVLMNEGAFTQRHIYTAEAVQEVIKYARLRGIRVIPEFDTPGHAHSWGKGKPDLLTPCWVDGKPGTAEYGSHWEYENFNPMLNSTFDFLDEFMQDVVKYFPDRFLHAGMDEAHYMCWESSPNVTEFMEMHNMNTTSEFEQYYVRRALDILSHTEKDVIIWQDPIDHGVEVQNSTIIEIWKNDRDIRDCHLNVLDSWTHYAQEVAKGGHKMIISSCWYLNYICYGEDWRRFYECDPLNFTTIREQQELVVGGEACLWAEFVDGTNFLQRAWPRAAAMAERVWSPSHVTDTNTAAFRLDAHRCRLLRRGIPAQPVLPGYCGDYEFGFDSDDDNNSNNNNNNNNCPTGGSVKGHSSLLLVLLSLICLRLVDE